MAFMYVFTTRNISRIQILTLLARISFMFEKISRPNIFLTLRITVFTNLEFGIRNSRKHDVSGNVCFCLQVRGIHLFYFVPLK
jgi:hypothetical protein